MAQVIASQKLVILGTGGNCIDILDTVIDCAKAGSANFEVIGFLDDDTSKHGKTLHGVPVLGALSKLPELGDVRVVNGIGSTRSYMHKPSVIRSLGLPDDRFATIIHPSAIVSNFARIGFGTVLLQCVVVASNAVIGKHVMVLPLTVVSHDTVLGDYAIIAGGVSLSGHVSVGRAAYVGSGASVLVGVKIGDAALVGMGSVVLRDVEAGVTVGGNPARVLNKKKG